MKSLTVLIVEEDEPTRALYLETLSREGWTVRALAAYDDVVPAATAARFDVAIIDVRFDAVALKVAEALAALPSRPRLIGITERHATAVVADNVFDVHLVGPCLPEDLRDAVETIADTAVPQQDLLIVDRSHPRGLDAAQRFFDIGARVEIRFEERHSERRHGDRRATSQARGEGERRRTERRRGERRIRDVAQRLLEAGWVLIRGTERS
jgi:DNA-binding response OmpR family regulator